MRVAGLLLFVRVCGWVGVGCYVSASSHSFPCSHPHLLVGVFFVSLAFYICLCLGCTDMFFYYVCYTVLRTHSPPHATPPLPHPSALSQPFTTPTACPLHLSPLWTVTATQCCHRLPLLLLCSASPAHHLTSHPFFPRLFTSQNCDGSGRRGG